MIFLEYPRLLGYNSVYIAVMSGSLETGGVGIEFSDTHVAENKRSFSFSRAKDIPRLKRNVWTEDTAPPEILAAWARYLLTEGV